MSRRLAERGCPQVHRRDRAKNPRACGPCGQPSPLTHNTVASLQRESVRTDVSPQTPLNYAVGRIHMTTEHELGLISGHWFDPETFDSCA